MSNPVEQLKKEYEAIGNYLSERDEVSMRNDLDRHFRKVLILSASSYYEHKITDLLSDFVAKKSGDECIVNFLLEGVIKQKYHTLFDWGERDKPQKHKLFTLFGENKKDIVAEIKANAELSETISAFIEIGELRNILVHSNFADYVYEQKTPDEIFTLFQTAEPFLDYLIEKLK